MKIWQKKYKSKVSQTLFKPFVRLSTEYDSIRKSDGMKIRVLDIALINVYTNTSYLIIFESPVALWDKNGEIGKQIVNQFALESEI